MTHQCQQRSDNYSFFHYPRNIWEAGAEQARNEVVADIKGDKTANKEGLEKKISKFSKDIQKLDVAELERRADEMREIITSISAKIHFAPGKTDKKKGLEDFNHLSDLQNKIDKMSEKFEEMVRRRRETVEDKVYKKNRQVQDIILPTSVDGNFRKEVMANFKKEIAKFTPDNRPSEASILEINNDKRLASDPDLQIYVAGLIAQELTGKVGTASIIYNVLSPKIMNLARQRGPSRTYRLMVDWRKEATTNILLDDEKYDENLSKKFKNSRLSNAILTLREQINEHGMDMSTRKYLDDMNISRADRENMKEERRQLGIVNEQLVSSMAEYCWHTHRGSGKKFPESFLNDMANKVYEHAKNLEVFRKKLKFTSQYPGGDADTIKKQLSRAGLEISN